MYKLNCNLNDFYQKTNMISETYIREITKIAILKLFTVEDFKCKNILVHFLQIYSLFNELLK